MSDNKNKKLWKSRLLSSSLPLEYEIAKILVNQGFSIKADFTYNRINEKGLNTEFSVDLESYILTPFESDNITSELNLLVECKYRHNGVKWLFLENANYEKFEMHGDSAINLTTFFSPYRKEKEFIFNTKIYQFESSIPQCYKGIEIKKDQVYDSEIKSGVSQLQYALFAKYIERLKNSILSHLDDNVPFAVCPILVTTADLYIANENFSIEEVKKSQNIKDISSEHGFIHFFSNTNPDFNKHASKGFLDILNNYNLEDLLLIESTKQKLGDILSSPLKYLKLWSEGDFLDTCFSQFIICNDKCFEQLVKKIKHSVEKDANTLENIFNKNNKSH